MSWKPISTILLLCYNGIYLNMKQFGVKLFIVKIADRQKLHYFPNSFEKSAPN